MKTVTEPPPFRRLFRTCQSWQFQRCEQRIRKSESKAQIRCCCAVSLWGQLAGSGVLPSLTRSVAVLLARVESWPPMSHFHRRWIFLNICIEKDHNVGFVVHAFQGIFPEQEEKLHGTFEEDWFPGETGVWLSPLPHRVLVRGRSTLLENMFAFHSWST